MNRQETLSQGPTTPPSLSVHGRRLRSGPVPTTMTIEEPTASEALAQARDDINEAREAFMRADGHRQAQCACAAIDSAATILVDPGATRREVVAAHSFLREALALDGRPNTCGAESIDTVGEASALPPEDQKWLQNYLLCTAAGFHARSARVNGSGIEPSVDVGAVARKRGMRT